MTARDPDPQPPAPAAPRPPWARAAYEEGRPPEPEVSLFAFLNVLLARPRLAVGVPLVAVALALMAWVVLPPAFTAVTTFVPEGRPAGRPPDAGGGIGSLAGQLGISFNADPSQSPRFYASVAKSRELLERILVSQYPDPRQEGTGSVADSATLLRILGVHGRDAADSLHRGVKKLRRRVSVGVDNQTYIVTLQVDSRYPALAAAVANRFVAYLNDFNTQTRQSQARERRKFLEQRITAAEADLRTAEDDLPIFYERNHSWQQSPDLVAAEARLRRQVNMRQEVYVTLRHQYETARMDEVNDTPVITVVDAAVTPQERSTPLWVWVVVALVLGSMVGVLGAFGAHWMERVRQEEAPDYEEFSTLLGQALRALRPTRRAR